MLAWGWPERETEEKKSTGYLQDRNGRSWRLAIGHLDQAVRRFPRKHTWVSMRSGRSLELVQKRHDVDKRFNAVGGRCVGCVPTALRTGRLLVEWAPLWMAWRWQVFP